MKAEIRTILSRFSSVVQPLDEPLDLGNAGGLSGARFWRYRSRLGELVLKRWPAPGPSRETLWVQHAWLRSAGALGIIPLPIAWDSGETFGEAFGHFWELQPWLSGSPPSTAPVDPAQVGLAFEALARVHECLWADSQRGPSPSLVSRLHEIRRWRTIEFEKVERAVSGRLEDRSVALVREWLESARAQASRIEMLLERGSRAICRLQPCLKDARREHWLFDGPRLVGLVDFGAMDRDSISADLSRLTTDWFDGETSLRDLALNAYSSVRAILPNETELLGVFDESADLLLGGHWVRWFVIESRRFEDPEAIVRGLSKGVERLSKRAATSRIWT